MNLNAFSIANIAIATYNMLVVCGVLFCIILRVPAPADFTWLIVIWAAVGAIIYAMVYRSARKAF